MRKLSSHKRRRGLAPKRFGKTDKIIGDVFDSLRDFFVGDALAAESVACGKGEARNNDATKIEHQTVGIRHHRHVTRMASRGAKKPDDFVLPRAPGELDHILGRGSNIIIVNRRSNEDAISDMTGIAEVCQTWGTQTSSGAASCH